MNPTTKAKLIISRISDPAALRILSKYCDEREREIGRRFYAKAVAETKERMGKYYAGDRLWCNAAGVFVGGPIQCGDEFVVLRDMVGRRRDLWVKHLGSGKIYSLNPATAHRYNLLPQKPENPTDAETRSRMERIGQRLAGLPSIGG